MKTLVAACAAVAALALAAPAAAAGYAFPLDGKDLNPLERYRTGTHKSGVQALGKDIGARRHVSGGAWSHLKEGGSDGKNADHLVYNKPFYAMADGYVIGCWRNAPENAPGSRHPDYLAGKFAGGGNHLWIRQDDGVIALYAHAVPGSIPAALCPHNAATFAKKATGAGKNPDVDPQVAVPEGQQARVTKGMMLGRVGNSGASSGPHLHVHMEKNGKSVPMVFERGLSTPIVNGKASLDGPWTRFAGKELPLGDILVWPARRLTAQYDMPEVRAGDYQRVFDHLADSGFLPDWLTCKNTNAGVVYDGKWIPASGDWQSWHGQTEQQYLARRAAATSDGFKQTSLYKCATDNGLRHVVVFRKP